MVYYVCMKKYVLICLLLFFVQTPGSAILPDDEMTTPHYVINNGYSQDMAEMVNMQRARATGEEIVPVKPQKRINRTPVGRFFRKCLEYLDPALDDDSFYVHDIKMEPQITDF